MGSDVMLTEDWASDSRNNASPTGSVILLLDWSNITFLPSVVVNKPSQDLDSNEG